jgi:hypothetical protein
VLSAYVAALRRRPDRLHADYLAGLRWLRAHATRDTVVFADNPTLVLSALGEVRLFYESGVYTPRWWMQGRAGHVEPYPERAALQERLLRSPDLGAVEAAHRSVNPGQRLLIVADFMTSESVSGLLMPTPGPVAPYRIFPEPRFRLLFANSAMHVYQALADADPRLPPRQEP